MNCPNCKALGTLRIYIGAPRNYVGCEAPDCHWSQEPLPEFVIEAAIKTYEKLQPIRQLVRETQERVYYSIGLAEGWPYGPHWVIWKHSFSGRSIADPRSWKFAEREQAQNALAEFVSRLAEQRGEVA